MKKKILIEFEKKAVESGLNNIAFRKEILPFLKWSI